MKSLWVMIFLVQGDCAFDAVYDEFFEGSAQPHQAFVACFSVDDEFGDEAIIPWRHGVAGIELPNRLAHRARPVRDSR